VLREKTTKEKRKIKGGNLRKRERALEALILMWQIAGLLDEQNPKVLRGDKCPLVHIKKQRRKK
jgi:hypothetical protein